MREERRAACLEEVPESPVVRGGQAVQESPAPRERPRSLGSLRRREQRSRSCRKAQRIRSLPEGAERPEPPQGAERPELPEGAEPPELPQGAEVPEGADIPEAATPSGPEKPSEGGSAKAGIADAPLAIVVSCQAGSELDAGLACQNMAAEAQLLGYGTKILTSPTMVLNGQERETYRELLDIPDDQAAAAVLLIGKEDTSLSEETDGVTGPSVRSAYEDMVTLLTGSDAGGSTDDAE